MLSKFFLLNLTSSPVFSSSFKLRQRQSSEYKWEEHEKYGSARFMTGTLTVSCSHSLSSFKYRMLFYLPFFKGPLSGCVIIIHVRHFFPFFKRSKSASRKCVKIFLLSGNFPFKLSTFYSSLIDRSVSANTFLAH